MRRTVSGGTGAGTGLGLAAFGIWGLLPLYWSLVGSASPLEVLAHRMLWSLPTAVVFLALVRGGPWIRPLLREPGRLGMLCLSASLISGNWFLVIWSVEQDRVLEASLGHFVMPLFTVAAGVVVLRERLRAAQWAAVALTVLAVVVMSVAYGRVPWIALALGVNFALYSLVKKKTALDGLQGFAADAFVQFLPAVALLAWLGERGEAGFATQGPGHALFLIGSGPVTAVPLILFGAAALRLRLSNIGLMQYVTPVLMLLLGLLVFDEAMPLERWAGFLLVWASLAIVSWDALRQSRHGPAPLPTPGTRPRGSASLSFRRDSPAPPRER
jgi:chloramphenicol-sensitive protein RarD